MEAVGRELVLRIQSEVELDSGLLLVVADGGAARLSPEVARFMRVARCNAAGLVSRIVLEGTVVLDPEYASGLPTMMLWFTQKVLRKEPGNWTFVLVTDRKELDEQLYGDFVDSGVITSGQQVHAESSAHLRELLGEDHRYVFTLIHKFVPPEKGQRMPVLSSSKRPRSTMPRRGRWRSASRSSTS